MAKKTLYTDGACSGNPGPGGWGALIITADKDEGTEEGTEHELHGGEAETTNNRMELTAAIKALEAVGGDDAIDLYTDSKYVRDGITQWIKNWKKNGWRTAAKKPVKNMDLWQTLDELVNARTITWHWVKGHDGDYGNERADALANTGMAPYL